jgi:hypothetical protein
MRRHEMDQHGIFKTGGEHQTRTKFAVRPGDNSCGISLGNIGREGGQWSGHKCNDIQYLTNPIIF